MPMRHTDESFCRALREILRCLLCCDDAVAPVVQRQVVLTVGQLRIALEGDFAVKTPFVPLIVAEVSFVDADGNPATIEAGSALWATDRADLFTLAPDPANELKCAITPTEPKTLGAGQITLTVDADLGSGVRELVVLGDLEWIAGEAVAGVMTFRVPGA